MDVSEGGVMVSVPTASGGGEGAADDVFFNATQELNRDLTVATLAAFREREPRAASYLDAMTASGIRGVRAANAGWDVTMADVDADAVALATSNLARNGLDGEVVARDANSLLHDHDRVLDVVDIDPFGSPMPFADAAFANARNLVCVTATDTAPLCGAHFESGVRKYSATPRNTNYHAEMGLRILLGALARTAARYDVGVTPILSHVSDHYVRTYLELDHRATDANAAVEQVGHVYHCQQCLSRDHEYGLVAAPRAECPRCGGHQVLTAGPLWLGPAHEEAFAASVREQLTREMGEASQAFHLLQTIEGELHEPTHYDQHRLYSQWGEPAVGMAEFLDQLRDAGLRASRTHFGGTTFKTDGGLAEVEAAVL
ncbi:tRNA (guanine(26)-N(2))-dimethyltransferase [Halobacterium salinarum]|uniref:tRNA (guanine(26)-N(2))-dimethyltransferase n=1 Tax=Halobacterium salinarum TaxID=2242 RepID=UPI001F3EB491|nr:tRNA (guanine(26)-N(2))-dimethyltransferase [Halobacterium salinarum]MCF2206559.1 tRNA (guanine(26)-N(2))-dimethyltransferase [Halobacterium salinarum]MCF2240296.1 tRNA (guanine(26)-N(2))-dimethyltransferase [Halobacterium salinarum]